MDFHGAFRLINEEEEDKYTLGSLFMSFDSVMDFIKKIPCLVSLIASIDVKDPFEVEFFI